MIAAAIRFADLLELVWVATLVTLAIVTVFAFGIRGSARAGELRRQGRKGAAARHAAVAVASYAGVGAAIVAGVLVIAFG